MFNLAASKYWCQTLLTNRVVAVTFTDNHQSLSSSNFPIGNDRKPERIKVNNDSNWPICGTKGPYSRGHEIEEWKLSAWPVIGEAFESAAPGQITHLDHPTDVSGPEGLIGRNFPYLFVPTDVRNIRHARRFIQSGNRAASAIAGRAGYLNVTRHYQPKRRRQEWL